MGPGDILRISVFKNPELTNDVRVSEAGTIGFPLIGSVQVSGLTPFEPGDLFSNGLQKLGLVGRDAILVAAAALLVHAAAIDGEMLPSERDKLHTVIKQRFALDDKATDELIKKATAAEQESVDLYHFTHLLNRTLDEPGRARIIEMMWEIVYADGQRDELEDNLLWRAADLLGVSPRERIELRRQISGEDGEEAETAATANESEDRSGA